MHPPNGLPFSCRARSESVQKSTDLVREAVGCNGGLGQGLQVMPVYGYTTDAIIAVTQQ